MLDPSRRKEIRKAQEARKTFDPQKEERLRLYANQNIGDATYSFANVPLMNSITANQFDAKSLPYQDVLDGVSLKGIGLKNFSVHDGNIVDKVFSARAKAYNNDKSGGELAVIRKMKEWGDKNNPAVSTFVQTGILVPGVTKDALLEAYDYGLRFDAKKMQTKPKGFFKSLLKGNIGAIAGALVGGLPGATFGASVQRGVEGDANPFSAFMSPEGQIFYDVAMSGKKGLEKGKGSTDPSFLANVGNATSITAPIGSALYNRQISGDFGNSMMETPEPRPVPTYAVDRIKNSLANTSVQPESESVIRDLNVLFAEPYYRRGVISTPSDPEGKAPELENISRLFGDIVARRALYRGEKTNPYTKSTGTAGSVGEASERNFNARKQMNFRDILNPFLATFTPEQQQMLNIPSSGGAYNYRFDPVQFGENPLGVQSNLAGQTSQQIKPITDFELEDLIRTVSRG